jgi:hypothetical protein
MLPYKVKGIDSIGQRPQYCGKDQSENEIESNVRKIPANYYQNDYKKNKYNDWLFHI